jgi:hypothetical protein
MAIQIKSQKFKNTLAERSKRIQGRVSYRIGFNAPYALYVHENKQARHPKGQAKFLESAIRFYVPRVNGMIADSLRLGRTLKQALDSAAKAILEEAKRRCPVDTGYLRLSGYYIVE